MDILTILGLGIGFGAVYIVMQQGGIVSLLFDKYAAILVFGGTLGATMISVPFTQMKTALRASFFTIFPASLRQKPELIINTLIGLCEKSKRSGIDSLQEDVVRIEDRFLAHSQSLGY